MNSLKNAEYSHIIRQCKIFSVSVTEFILHVRIDIQRMDIYRHGELTGHHTISTSHKPPSNREHSNGTPVGLHCIDGKVGDGQPEGMIFKGRVPTGRSFAELSAAENRHNLITTRILRLRGLEPGVNSGAGCDSYDRYIYIHGTNHEDQLGKPHSHGCVLLGNREIADLYQKIPDKSLVYISG